MDIKVGDVFICTSTHVDYPNFKLLNTYSVARIDYGLVQFKGVERLGKLDPEHDYYTFSNSDIEATFERPKPPF